jgi:ribosomal protein L34E
MIVSDSLIAAFQALPPMFLQPCVSDPGMGARVPIPSGPRPCRDKLAPNRWPHDHTAIITTYLKTPTTRAVLGTAPKANVVALCATNPQSGAISVDFEYRFHFTPMADGQRRPAHGFGGICCTKTLTRSSC